MNDMSITLHLTAPKSEKKAAKELRREKIKAIVPRYKVTKPKTRNQHAKATTTKILAPGYVLARGNARYRHYVRHRLGGVTAAEVHRLLKRARKQQQVPAIGKPYAVGDMVTITLGPFTDFTGKIIEDKGRTVRIEHESGTTVSCSVYHLTRPHE